MKKKDNHNNMEETDHSLDSRYVMFSLLSQKHGTAGGCPDVELLSAFFARRLRGNQREKIMAHLNDCADCRRLWILVGSAMSEMDDPRRYWLSEFSNKIKAIPIKLRHVLTGGGIGIVLAVCLLLFILTPGKSDVHEMLSKSYAGLSAKTAARSSSSTIKGEDGNRQGASTSIRIFREGVTDGKATLSQNTDALTEKRFNNHQDSLFYAMGQWTVLLQCVCISAEPDADEFWSQQAAIASAFLREAEKAVDTEGRIERLMQAVTAIQKASDYISETGDKIGGCDEMTFTIETFQTGPGAG